jgi:hypothetical protein
MVYVIRNSCMHTKCKVWACGYLYLARKVNITLVNTNHCIWYHIYGTEINMSCK